MTLPSWPLPVPFMPQTSGFGVREPHLPHAETEFEGGSYRRRPRSTLRRALMPMTWLFDDAAFDEFRGFYHLTLIEGSLRFTMEVPDGPGGAYTSRTCMFKGMYQVSQSNPPHWDVVAELYVFGGI